MLSSAFKSYAQHLRQLHKLIKNSCGDSEEADELRETMDGAWAAMDADERSLTRVLSADFYDLNVEGPREEVQSARDKEKLKAVSDAGLAGDYHFALSNLREVQRFLPPDVISYLRGRSWSKLGDNDTAVVFFDRSVELAPDNAQYRYLALDARAKSEAQRNLVAQQVEQILAHPEQQPEILVAKAADLRFVATRNLQNDAANLVYRQLLNVYDRLIPRFRAAAELNRSVFAQVLTMKGLCHEHLNELNAALAAYTDALQIQPENEGALAARGLLSYGQDARAMDDLRTVCDHDTPLVWPFFFLAHHSLRTGQYQACVAFSLAALQRYPTKRAEADILEWLAISYHQLGAPAEQVEVLFRRAVERAPESQRIAENAARFKALVASPLLNAAWTYETEDSVREYGRMVHAREFQPMLAA